jgi:hypothetical protein
MKVDPLERASMKTAAEYRAMAEECLSWAREAQTSEVRASYSQLAQVWLDAAYKLDGLPSPGQRQRLTSNWRRDHERIPNLRTTEVLWTKASRVSTSNTTEKV